MPFEVPKGWVWTTLGEIAESNIGLTYKPSDICNDGVPVYRSNNIQGVKIDTTDIVRVQTTILDKQFLKEGDLLICARNGSRRLVGKNAIIRKLTEKTAFGAFMAVCRSKYNPWLHLLLQTSYFDKYLDESNSTAINQVTQSMLLALNTPLPPLAEQQRIVAEIERWFALIDTIEQGKVELQTAIKQTKSKILDLAIHGKLVPQDPSDEPASELLKRINPKAQITCDNEHSEKFPQDWEHILIGDYVETVTDFVANGSFASLRENVKYYNEPNYAILVRTKDFQNNFKQDLVYTDPHGYEFLAKSNLFGGELIFSNVGSIGKIFIVPELNQKMTLAPNAIMVRIHNDKQQKWLYYLFLSTIGQNLLDSITSATAIGKFNKTDFKKLSIPIPPLAEQQRIVQKIETLFSVLDNIQETLEVS